MKKVLLISIFIVGFLVSNAQDMQHDADSTYTNTVTKKYVYEDIEQGWEYIKGKWFYCHQQLDLSPVFYKYTATIDSTCTSNEWIERTYIKKEEASTGTYETNESDWKWDANGWRYKGHPVKSFPPSFYRKATVIIVTYDVQKDEVKNSKTIQTEEFYQIKVPGWLWDSKDRKWLLNGSKTNQLPPYVVTNSSKAVKNSGSM